MKRVLLLGCFAAAAAFSLDLSDLFDGSSLHEVRLTIHPSDWQKLRDNYLGNDYYPATLEWRGMVVEEVAIRSRGLGSRNQEKPGLRVDFNRYQDQTFLGLKSLVLDNAAQDHTMMAERLSMEMFRRIGLPAPRLVHARLYVNGQYTGLYNIIEPVDKGFLKRNLGEDDGYLYDYEWFSEYRFEYLGPSAGAYVPAPFEPQTHEKDPKPGPLVEMIRVMNEAPDEEFAAAMSNYLDLKRVASYLAVETFIAEFDGLAGDWGINNLYFYQTTNGTRFELIPWDKDVTLQNAQAERSIWQNFDSNVLTRRMMKVPEVRAHYIETLRRCADIAGGADGWLEREIARVYDQIRVAALDDTRKPQSNGEFEQAVSEMGAFAFSRPENVRRQAEAARAIQ